MSTDFTGPATPLEAQDFMTAAETLCCPEAAVRAVVEVEARGRGFLPEKKPKILFESRWFHKLTAGQYDATHPDISTPKWVRNYAGGSREYERLEKAIGLNREAALKATSWGMFQILGVNHRLAGFSTVEAFVTAQTQNETAHLQAFVAFVTNRKLDDELRDQRWADFARAYNGPGYDKNRYDEKLAAAFEKHSSGVITPSTLEVQRALVKQGYAVTTDGVTGSETRNALLAFQRDQGLVPDGKAGPKTLSALELEEMGDPVVLSSLLNDIGVL